jgi:hypothetical protein
MNLCEDRSLGGFQAARRQRSIVKLGNTAGSFSQRGAMATAALRVWLVKVGHLSIWKEYRLN